MAGTVIELASRPDLNAYQHQTQDKSMSYSSVQYSEAQVPLNLGRPQRKKRFNIKDAAVILGNWICFAVACITINGVPGYRSIPWSLGVTRQFQIIGFLLSLMYQFFQRIAPKFYLLLEASMGSYLQNYEAILRNSSVRPNTNPVWRAILMIFIIIPSGLSVIYKNFDHGVGYSNINSGGNNYSWTPPAGVENFEMGEIGLSIMANSTQPFASATFSDPALPVFPAAYGFNTLLLSNTSSARLDGPVPAYLRELQGPMKVDEAYMLTADVHGVVTSYNDSIETLRNDDNFWNYYLGMTGDNEDRYISASNQSAKDSFLASEVASTDMYHGWTLSLLMNDLGLLNDSWAFAAFVNESLYYTEASDGDIAAAFRSSAMLFQTRRESCRGTWRITYNSIQLINGSCDGPRLPESSQEVFTKNTLALRTFYTPMLCEYLQDLSSSRNASVWKVPTVATVMAGMYWSRVTRMRGKTPEEVPYHVQDRLVSERVVMNSSPWLLFVFAIFPALTTLASLGCLALYSVPLDGEGFGTVALLAGVRPDTLAILDGASTSGKLKRSVSVRFVERNRGLRKDDQHIEYVLVDGTRHDERPSPVLRQKIIDGPKYRPLA
ncbi:MAG: hypothetical protein Q9190_000547 [Brigantiaea leucoxantha]